METKFQEFYRVFGKPTNTFSLRAFYNQWHQVIDWVEEHNTGRPYHSTRHLIGVGVITDIILSASRVGHNWPNKTVRQAAILAGLLHDFCHLGEKDDWKNIEHVFKELNRLGFWSRFPDFDKTLTTLLIGFTHYNFDDPFPQYPGSSTMRFLFGTIRDADQLYAMTYLDKEIFHGLYQEIGVRFGQTLAEFTDRNIKYIDSVKFYTAYGDEMAKTYREEAKKNCLLFSGELVAKKSKVE